MKRKVNLIAYVFASLLSGTMRAQTGIGTTAPVNKLEVVTATADPASTGLAANGNLRLGGLSANHVIDFGLSSTSTFGWIQTRSKAAYGTNYILGLNPNGGYVGIGTTNATSMLTVGNATGTIPGEIALNPTATTNEGGQILIKKSLSGGTNDWIIDHYGTSAANARLRLFNSNEVNGIVILESGFVGMGTSTPTVRLQVSGDIIANSIAGSSDRRFKTNITPISNALDKVMQLRGVNFDWNQTLFPDRNFPSTRSMGFIAQEVEQVIPEVVQSEKNADAYKAVHYDKVVALLVEAIKEQQQQIKQLQKQVNKLRRKQ